MTERSHLPHLFFSLGSPPPQHPHPLVCVRCYPQNKTITAIEASRQYLVVGTTDETSPIMYWRLQVGGWVMEAGQVCSSIQLCVVCIFSRTSFQPRGSLTTVTGSVCLGWAGILCHCRCVCYCGQGLQYLSSCLPCPPLPQLRGESTLFSSTSQGHVLIHNLAVSVPSCTTHFPLCARNMCMSVLVHLCTCPWLLCGMYCSCPPADWQPGPLVPSQLVCHPVCACHGQRPPFCLHCGQHHSMLQSEGVYVV